MGALRPCCPYQRGVHPRFYPRLRIAAILHPASANARAPTNKTNMNTFHQNSLPARILRVSKIAGILVMLATLAACSSLKTTASPLPIEMINSTGGKVVIPHAYQAFDRLYASGSIEKSFGSHIPNTAHVDVRLIDAEGRVISEKIDSIEPAAPRSASSVSGRYSYVATFPLSQVQQATKIVIRYDMLRHRP